MIDKIRFVVVYLFLVLAFPACNRFDVKEFSPPSWETDLLGPLAFTTMKLEDINELSELEYTKEISVGSLGIPTGSGFAPAIDLPDLGPFNIHFFDEFYFVEADSISLSFTIENNLPVDIDSGGTIELSNAYGNMDILYSHTFDDVIPKFSSLTFNVIVVDKRIDPDIIMWLYDFSTKEEDNATVTDSNSISVSLRLDFIRISRASVKENTTIVVSDTTNFNLKGDDLEVISISGDFNTYIDNGFPYAGELQAYFLTQDSELLDSLFEDDNNKVEIADYDRMTGEVTDSRESKLKVYMDSTRVKKILDSKKIYFRITLTSPENQMPLYANNDYPVNAQMVGDLHVIVENQ